ncbi:hypothetical protein ASZ90_014381 [hydrocarbon metagenome]|uniref:Uncharacterized protein n=1 Tax=hydrocarbon metagenome TaxID=938273 RepID=A0A0W8F511_9ZZZZ
MQITYTNVIFDIYRLSCNGCHLCCNCAKDVAKREKMNYDEIGLNPEVNR